MMKTPTSFRGKPIRYQIRQALLDYIKQEGFQPGDQLPPEERLQEILDVSRLSMREALQLLEEERIILTKHGSGRYLITPPSSLDIDISNLQSVTELLSSYNIAAENKLLRFERHPANKEITKLMGLDKGEEVLSIDRIRYAGDVPIIYSIDTLGVRWLPPEWKESDFGGSLFEYVEKRLGIELAYSQANIHASLIQNTELPFGTGEDMAWILLTQLIYTQSGEPIIYSRDYHRGDQIQFHVRRIRR
jgi:GntR family transcriptional regulator